MNDPPPLVEPPQLEGEQAVGHVVFAFQFPGAESQGGVSG